MSNEPRICLKSLTSRVDLTDYAKCVQIVDTMKDANDEPLYKDLSTLARAAIHSFVEKTELDQQHKEWVDVQTQMNIERRQKLREKHRSFFSRMFHR